MYQNFYIEHPDVSKRSEHETTAWRNKCGIVIQGEGIPKPAMTFEEASMPEYVLREVMKQGFSAPTPIQSQGWPMALLGRDMVGISATGSGKTLAFLLPAMIHINAQVWREFPFGLLCCRIVLMFFTSRCCFLICGSVGVHHIKPFSITVLRMFLFSGLDGCSVGCGRGCSLSLQAT